MKRQKLAALMLALTLAALPCVSRAENTAAPTSETAQTAQATQTAAPTDTS